MRAQAPRKRAHVKDSPDNREAIIFDVASRAASSHAPEAGRMGMRYDEDVILWSLEQARLLRGGQFSQLDIEHLADEIEDVGKSEKRELANRMSVLLAHTVSG